NAEENARESSGSGPRVVGGGRGDFSADRDPGDGDLLPVPAAGDLSAVLSAAAAAAARGASGAMATVLERHGSAPGTPGQKLLVSSDGVCVGTVGGRAVERAVLASLVALARDRSAKHTIRTFKLGPELGMCCGGRLEILLE